MSRPVDALLEFLRAEEARGVSHVHLDADAREVMRALFLRSKEGPASPKPAREVVTSESVSMPMETTSPAPAAVNKLEIHGGSAAEKIASLRVQAERWSPARNLGSLRETMVFSAGDPDAELMLVGEAPGYQEERQGAPFVGPAGRKLDDILKAMGLDREQVYLSNIVKFRPAMPEQTTSNRKPTLEEMAACLPFIRAEVSIVRPKCIVALGATAAEGLLGLTGPVARMRGDWHDFEGIPTRVSYHPAYLLHGSAGLKDKRMIWEDMLAVMERLELPVSDKQRAFFLPKS